MMRATSTLAGRSAQQLVDGQWIQAMIAALDGSGGSADAAAWPALQVPAVRVYRNTVRLAALDALRANYRSVRTMVGDAWFDAVAHAFVDVSPPASPCLLDYGAAFPEFLSSLDVAAELPYLPGVAALDRAWTESHIAADAEAVPINAVVCLIEEGARLQPHPAARARWFGETPAAALWRATRDGEADLSGVPWQAAGALLTRPQWQVHWVACDAVTTALLQMFIGGRSIADALNAMAVAAGPEATGQSFHQLIAQGALMLAPAGDLL